MTPLPDEIDLIISPRWLVPVVPRGQVLEQHAIAVHQGRIIALLPQAEAAKLKTRERRELPNHVLIPGLVNAHGHAAMSLFRGLADDLPLMTWLNEHIWPAEGRWVNEDFVRVGTRLAVAEMLRGGTTCFADMYFYPDVAAQVASEAGIRAQLAFPVIDNPIPGARDSAEAISRGLRLHDDSKYDDLISVAFGPHSPYTVGDETLIRVRTLADELDLPVHMHVHETAFEVEEAIRQSGMRPLQRLRQLGLLSPRLQAVHMTQIDQQDMQLLVEFGVQVIHCPESNMKLASGFCPVQRLLASEVNVALGTDGAASNNDLDMFGELRTAALIAKGISGMPTALDAHSALHMATLAGAQALGLGEQTGSLEAGKVADMVAVDLSALPRQPAYHPVSQLLYACNASQVSDVWVAGKQRVRAGELLLSDQDGLMAAVQHWAQQIQQGDTEHDA
ncbi:MAG: TRZ/ATZ family hydrolase [Pseudomonas sp.]